MSATCPNGHVSASTDYCDVCGAPMAAPAGPAGPPESASPDPAEASAPAPQKCPNCGANAPAGALFCENCGYDFTTGTAPSALDLGGVGTGSVAASAAGSSAQETGDGEVSDPGAATDPEVAEPATGSVRPASDPTPVNPAGPDAWVAEVWIDPDWYAEQQPEDPLPPVGAPRIIPLRESSLLVGRPSKSRGIHPQIDVTPDTGASRRQSQLTSDGRRWWVEDLASANGTYVAAIGDPLPTSPIRVAEKRELAEGDRIYLGGWTRLQVRRALPGEA